MGLEQFWGGYLHIEKESGTEKSQMKAYAILNLRKDTILFSHGVMGIFIQNEQSYKTAFLEYKRSLSENNQRCSFGEGCVSLDGNLAIISLSVGRNGAKWNIIIDLKEYLNCPRIRTNENDYYRGGLGLAFVSRTINGTSCFRLGLVRKTFVKEFISLENAEMKARLKLLDDSKDAIWKPLKLSGWLDKLWYDWILNE